MPRAHMRGKVVHGAGHEASRFPAIRCWPRRRRAVMDSAPMMGKRPVYGPRMLMLALLLLVPLLVAFVLAQWCADRWSLGLAWGAYASGGRVLANGAVALSMFLLLAALTRQLLLPLLLVAGGHALFYAASAIKLRLLGLPVMLPDLHFLTAIDAASLHLFLSYVDITLPMAVGAGAMLVVLMALFWLEPRWCRPLAWSRLIVGSVAMALLASLWMAVWPWSAGWYGRDAMRPSPLSAMPAALHGGLMPSLIYYHHQQRHRRLDVDVGALREAVAQLKAQRAGLTSAMIAAKPGGAQPDVVIVLSESFMDPFVLKGMQELPDLIPNMRAALGRHHGGTMLAPTFGGGTVRTEFEVLTGMPVEAFQDVYYPYVDLSVDAMPGVVSELERRGYSSLAIHGNAGSFWNRSSTYRAMGVDRFITQRMMKKAGAVRDGGWTADRSMTDILLKELGRSSKPTVAIAISIESHGPYDGRAKVLDPAALASIRLPPGLDPAAAFQLRNYLYHLHNADKELGRLLEALRGRQRPFVLLFFGDHLPAFQGVYEQLGFVDGREGPQQYVPWLLVSDAPGSTVPPVAYPWELPALTVRAAGEDDLGWFDFVRQVGEQMRANPSDAKANDILIRGLNAGANARLSGKFDTYLR